MARKATIERKTKETDIRISLDLDGSGQFNIKTAVPFMDHMFSHVAKHGFFDLVIKAKGDTEIDDHHTVEDLGICLGEARRNGAHLPVTALVDQFYSEVQKMGGNRWDSSSLIAVLDR